MDTTVEKRDEDNEDVKSKSVKSHKRKRKQHVVTVDTSRAGDSTIGALKPCMAKLGLKQVPQGQNTRHCDIHWQVVFRRDHDSKHGIHNKFPGMSEICGKMSLSRTLDFLQDLFPEEFDFYPKTWYLPVQYEKFQSDVEKLPKRRRSKNIHVYIVKPDSGSKGEGIFLIHNPKEYRNFGNQSHVVQEYMSNVYIIDGFKFDLRIYAVIKSLEPLEFYICTEGLARFSTVLYRKPNVKNLKDSFMHLTNYSLNKHSSGFDRSENEDEGSKRTLTSVFHRLEQDGHDTGQVWENIEKVVCKTILALVPEMKIQYRAVTPPKEKGPSCFQIVGLDILLLDDLTPILMEVNSKPSLSINSEKEVSPGIVEHVPSPKDKEVKLPLITDTLRLIIPPHRLEFCLERRRRLLARRNKVAEKNQLSNDENRDQGHDVVTLISEMNVKNKENKPEDMPEECTSNTANSVEEPTDNKHGDDKEDLEEKEDVDEECDDNEEDEKEEEEDEIDESNCLKEIYSQCYSDEYDRLRILERVAELFIIYQGVKGSSGISGSAFRTFTRKCKLETRGISNPELDILYLGLRRRWELLSTDLMTGLCYKGFVEGCLDISQRIFSTESTHESLISFLDFCEMNLSSTCT